MVCHNDVASVFQGLRWNGKVLEEAHSVWYDKPMNLGCASAPPPCLLWFSVISEKRRLSAESLRTWNESEQANPFSIFYYTDYFVLPLSSAILYSTAQNNSQCYQQLNKTVYCNSWSSRTHNILIFS
jgi:hypothetical protein